MTHPWEEPVRGVLYPNELRGLSGIEQLRLFLSGHVGRPPIGELTGMHPTEVGVGTATFTMPITRWLQAPQGTITGGAVGDSRGRSTGLCRPDRAASRDGLHDHRALHQHGSARAR